MNGKRIILASMLLVILAIAVTENFETKTIAFTTESGTEIGQEQFQVYADISMGKPFGCIGLNGTLRFWNGTVGTHEGGLQKWPMYWFIFIDTQIWVNDNETFSGGCLVSSNWQEQYGWRTIGVSDAKAHGMKIIVIDSFEELAIICWSVDRTLLIKLYLSKTWLAGPSTEIVKQEALDYFNMRWQTNLTIDEVLANQGSPWT